MEDELPLVLSQNGSSTPMVSAMEGRPKRRKPGIVYLSSIPPNMNVAKIREYFSRFGTLDRVFLQAADKDDSTKGHKAKKFKKTLQFTEGWLEFKSKRKAKQVHLYLNNQPVGGKKKNPYYDMLWNIKYLPRFKWAYLKQRLEYEREVMRQRMGAEISQVRKETDHFIKLSEISNKKKRRKNNQAKVKGGQEGGEATEAAKMEDKERVFIFKQKETEEEKLSKKEERKRKNELFKKRIAEKKKKKQKKKADKPEDILGSVFVGAA